MLRGADMIFKSQRCARFNRFYSKAQDIIEAVRAAIDEERRRKQAATQAITKGKGRLCVEQIPHKQPERTRIAHGAKTIQKAN
jgi:hypothetical protein